MFVKCHLLVKNAILIFSFAPCISYFNVTVIKYHDQINYRRQCLFEFTIPKGVIPIMVGKLDTKPKLEGWH